MKWLGASPLSVDELLAGVAGADRPRDQAAVFLEQFPANGPRTSRDIWEAAQKANVAARTLNRAKRGLGIWCRRVQVDGRPVSYWLLPDQELPSGLSGNPVFDEWLAQWLKQYPHPTPLDEDDVADDSA